MCQLLYSSLAKILFLIFYFVDKTYLFIERQGQRERHKEREIFCSCVHSPDGSNSQNWAGPKPRARNSQVSHRVRGPKGLVPPLLHFQAISWELDQKQDPWGSNHAQMGCRHHRQGLSLLCYGIDILHPQNLEI